MPEVVKTYYKNGRGYCPIKVQDLNNFSIDEYYMVEQIYYKNGSLYNYPIELDDLDYFDRLDRLEKIEGVTIVEKTYHTNNGNLKKQMEFDCDMDCYINKKCYHENGVLKTEYCSENELIGIKKDYYESGNLKSTSECMYHSDREDFWHTFHGLQKKYYESGTLRKETFYNNGEKHGVQKYYYESSSSETPILKAEFPYVKNKIHGIVKEYDESGNLFTETTYENDEAIGEPKFYLDDESSEILETLKSFIKYNI
jgi:hypothetical protein